MDETGRKIKIHSKNIYAIVYKAQPFVATEYGYYSIMKSADNNFYFTGDVRTAASNGDMAAARFAVGLIGAALASSGSEDTYVMMVDYRNGAFIHLKKIEKPLNQ